ncbi:hypothetical protein T492DRAFT_957114 [Pavlovales sp. CCMP2436]|nr:hypothetical protein T492DRAFT_957114 [Pavlovales sp. CCMP2436]
MFDGKFPCDEAECAYRATNPSDLTRHKRTHSGKRPFPCDEAGCGYSAARSDSLKEHKRTHRATRARTAASGRSRATRRAAATGLSCGPPQGAQAHAQRRAAVPVRRGGLRVQRHYCE